MAKKFTVALVATMILAVILVGCGSKSITTTVAQIRAEAQDNIEKAHKKYAEKELVVTGYFVADLDFGNEYHIFLGENTENLGTASLNWTMDCTIPKSAMDGLDFGAKITVSGFCSSLMDTGGYLKSCKIVEVISKGGHTVNSSGTDSAESTQPSGVSEVPKEIDLKAGPVLAYVDSRADVTNVSIFQIDIETGEEIEIFPHKNVWGLFDPSFPEMAFDAKAERIAVGWHVRSDNSRHVGWVDRNWNLTDVTKIITAGASDFASAPWHKNPRFTSDGKFLFTHDMVEGDISDRKSLYSVFDPETMSLIEDVEYSDTSTIMYNGKKVYRTGSEGFVETIDNGDELYLIKGQTLAISVNGGEAKAITPKTDYDIIGAAASGNRVAFVAMRGEERTLFVTTTDGDTQPKKVASLDRSTIVRILFWR
jgi:hypothetical protein